MIMPRIGFQRCAFALTAISFLACSGLPAATAAGREESSNARVNSELRKFSAENMVLKSPSQVATFVAENGHVIISTRQGDQLKKRAAVSFESVKRFQGYKTVRAE